MSYIIECPDCSTRYKLNKPIPEGGQTVKCARCAYQWLLTPGSELPDEEQEPQSQQQDQQSETQTDAYSQQVNAETAEPDVNEQPEEDSIWTSNYRFPSPDTALVSDHIRQEEDGTAFEARDNPISDTVNPGGNIARESTDTLSHDAAAFGGGAEYPEDSGPDTQEPEISWAMRTAAQNKPQSVEDETAYAPSWQDRKDRYSEAISTLSQPEAPDYPLPAEEDPAMDQLATQPGTDYTPAAAEEPEQASHLPEQDRPQFDWMRGQQLTPEEAEQNAADIDDYHVSPGITADVSEQSVADETNQLATSADEPDFGAIDAANHITTEEFADTNNEQIAQERSSWADRFKFGRSKPQPQIQPELSEAEQQESEDELRKALSAALDHPEDTTQQQQGSDAYQYDEFGASADSGDRDVSAYADAGQAGMEYQDELARFAADGNDPAIITNDPAMEKFAEAGEEPPFRLTGENANKPVYQAGDTTAQGFSETGDDGFVSSFQNELEDAFAAEKNAPAAGAPASAPRDQSQNEFIEDDFSNLYDQQFQDDPDRPRDPADALNEDLAALQSELSGTHVTAYQHEHSGGGLAVVAAWAVFISVLSGMMLALVTFRQDIMAALPGTTTLYSSLGFEIKQVGVDFADVSYRWTTSDGKPMIEVKGQVVNITSETVRVPPVRVNVRGSGDSDAVQATASVQTQELAPRQSASFSLEFLSPPADVAQIELEFDKIKE